MNDHQWLMNSQALNILRKLRKRLYAEFGLSLRFSDFDFEQQLAQVKNRSVDVQTRNLIEELESLRGAPFLTGHEPPERRYRGQKILQEPSKKDIYEMIYGEELSRHSGKGKLPKPPLKMYRGRYVLS